MKKIKNVLAAMLFVLLLSSCGPSSEVSQSQSVPKPQSPASQSDSPLPDDSSSSVSSSQSASSSSVSSASSQPAVHTTWWQEGLAQDKLVYPSDPNMPSCGNPYSYLFLYDDAKKLSVNAFDVFAKSQDAPLDIALLLDTAKETEELGSRILSNYFFEIVALDDTKYTGEFYEKGILLTQSLPKEGKGKQAKLSLDAKDYQEIQKKCKEKLEKEDLHGYLSWLTMMRRSRITSLTITSSDGAYTKDYKPFDPYIYEDVNTFWASPAKTTSQTSLPEASHVQITFNNGLVYDVYYTSDNILIHASDVESSLLYELTGQNMRNLIDAYAQGRVNPRTGKPVIYLYPTHPTDCTVKVGYERFSYTYPAYQNGWFVTAYPDGRLVNKADGSEHYYLFWEGNKRIEWDFFSGFVVNGSETEAFLREKLAFLGLTPREYNDFITYWVPQMKDSPYNLVTFAGEQYEALAPLSVTPQPDSILRVHMVFRSLDAPVQIPPQQLRPFERKGFAVVEWGGTNASY